MASSLTFSFFTLSHFVTRAIAKLDESFIITEADKQNTHIWLKALRNKSQNVYSLVGGKRPLYIVPIKGTDIQFDNI